MYASSRLMEELRLVHRADEDATGQKEQQREGETPTAELRQKIDGDGQTREMGRMGGGGRCRWWTR